MGAVTWFVALAAALGGTCSGEGVPVPAVVAAAGVAISEHQSRMHRRPQLTAAVGLDGSTTRHRVCHGGRHHVAGVFREG